jgi:hypothetical protein
MRISPQPSSAITLIELLVVLVLIATLVVMVLPSRRGGPKQRFAPCVQNLKEMGSMWSLYAADNHDRLPSPQTQIQPTPSVISSVYSPITPAEVFKSSCARNTLASLTSPDPIMWTPT